MAKVETTALVSEITGSWNATTFKRTKSGIIIKPKTTPRRPRSEFQQSSRQYLAELSGDWSSLSASEKSMWNQYASLLGRHMTGISAFVKLNMNLHNAQHVDLVKIAAPPSFPSRPSSLESFGGRSYSSTENRLLWSSPDSADIYVSVYYSVRVGITQTNKEAWHLVGTIASNEGEISHFHDLPSGFLVDYVARTIDLWGRTSPFTQVITSPFSAYFPVSGRYGFTSYGYSYYGP